jgi:hypothetical protein
MEDNKYDDELQKDREEILRRLKELEGATDWKENGTKPCAMFKKQVEGRVASKGIAIVDFNIEKVFEFLHKEESLGKINSQIIEIKVLYERKDVFKVNYQQYKGIWPVANRDFVSVGIEHKESPEKIYIGTKECNYPYPETKGVVRGKIYIGGYILEKVDEGHTKVTYISDADLSGNIPQMVQNQLSAKQGEVASRIQSTMQKSGL